MRTERICAFLKKYLLICLSVLLMMSLFCGFDSRQERVYDEAGLLSDGEEAELTELLVSAAHETKQDFVVVTIDDNMGKSARDYADDFYDDHKFGYEKENGSGVLLLIDMDGREVYISTAGTAIEQYTDREIEWTLDEVVPYLSDGDYMDACTSFVDCAKEYLTGGETSQNGYYDKEQDRFVETDRNGSDEPAWKEALRPSRLLINLLIAAVFSAVIVFLIARNRKTKMSVGDHTYLKDGRVKFRDKGDRFTHTTVITRQIPKDNGGGSGGGGGHSSSHVSSGGHSHGGGGRSF